MSRLALSLPLVALLATSTLGCKLFQDGDEVHHRQTIEAFKVKVQALQAALDAAPTKAEGFRLPEGESLRICGHAIKCEDGQLSNTVLLDPEERLTHLDQLLVALDKDPGSYTLAYALEHSVPRYPNARYLAVRFAEEVQAYDVANAEQRARWSGRVAVWDSQSNEWIGAVRIDLRADELTFKFYEMVDLQGNVKSGPFRDEEGDKKNAQFKFDQLVYEAVPIAIETGRDITRFDQIVRSTVESKKAAVTVERDAVLLRTPTGALLALQDGAYVDLGINDVSQLWGTPTGILFRLAKNKLPKDAPYFKRMHDGMIEDLSFHSERFSVQLEGVDLQGDPWLSTEPLANKEGAGAAVEIAQWVDGDWQVTSLEGLEPEARWLRGLGHSADGSTQTLLTSGDGGAAVHVGSGASWRSLALEGSAMGLVVEADGSALVHGGEGLFRVTAGDPLTSQRLSKSATKALVLLDDGRTVAVFQSRSIAPHKFAIIDGTKVVKIAKLHSRSYYGVGRDGTIAAHDFKAVSVRSPAGDITRYPARGEFPRELRQIEVDGSGRVWMRAEGGTLMVIADGELSEFDSASQNVADIYPLGKGAAPVNFVPVTTPE